MTYSAFAGAGLLLAVFAARFVPADDATPPPVALRVRAAALFGGIAGAYGAELPARLLGLSASGEHGTWLGRTVLGGLLFGWLAVELAKRSLGYRVATGDRFALPLAIGLAIGRLGCVVAGCCAGVHVDRRSLAGRVGLVVHGEARFPAALAEAYFHAIAAMVLVAVHRSGRLRGARLAAYLTAYAALRFALETVREAPRIGGLVTYYQLLAIALFALAASTLVARLRRTDVDAAGAPGVASAGSPIS